MDSKSKTSHLFILLLLVVCSGFIDIGAQNLKLLQLKCNSQLHPIAIESPNPKFSWIVQASGYNKEQSAYQIIVASQKEFLSEDKADMWSSGKVKSSASINILYSGKALGSATKYWWKVKIWDEEGNESGWSAINSFEMGLLDRSDWDKAKWVSLSKDDRRSEHRFRDYKTSGMKKPTSVTSHAVGYFRNEINTTKKVKRARAYICGLGYYELYINGEKTGDHVLDPAPSNYDKQAYYVIYDVTDQISKGKNAIGIILGNGFYGQSICWKRDPESERDLSFGVPAVKLMVDIEYDDGSTAQVLTDESWKNSTGPIVFDNIYGGDTYDARYEIQGWNKVNYNDKKWSKVKTVSPKLNKVSANQMPPIKRLYTLEPKKVFKSPSGKWIVDFGQNIAGWVKINVKEEKGQVITIRTTEALTQAGDDIFLGSTGGGANGMAQILTYICKGKGLESWEPKFSYHGFRYAELSGISTNPDVNIIQAIVVANDIEQTGSFASSDQLFNKMDTISKWTIVDNLHGIPEDCPHREKCGWLGDAHAFCEYALYNYDMKTFYEKYMEDIRTQMRPTPGKNDPTQRFLVPTMIAPGKRTSSIAKLDWGIAAIYLPWYNYLYYGDASIVKEYYKEMKQLTNYYLSFKNQDGIIDNGMGDWCPPLWDRRQNPKAMECDPVVSANTYFYDILGVMKSFASLTQDDAYAETLQKEQVALKEAFDKQYLERIPLVGHLWYGSQTATVMALQFGMVSNEKIESVIDGLVYNIEAVKGGHHATGIHGNRYIYTVLTKYGKADLAYKLLTTPTFPSQTYIMNYGFTTWPERQFYWDEMEGLTNSLNHPMHSGFAAYFYESLGGIKPLFKSAGFKNFSVNPMAPQAISKTKVCVPTPYGQIKNTWHKKDGIVSMKLSIPFNTKAIFNTDDIILSSLSINGKKHVALSHNSSELVLGSGEYLIEYSLKELE
ncbi:family 78 glycoside hydrolase catalytic domain [Saccharicrinis aurantiacus]|uniref:family 78 glycoside hydrolase catalytic domain n=1 Tax=Saccharicrinis aurantiacus TaxID=1849719 RepID=UPI0024900993|nr:family 78 glycoside hydrolase catalytic domain [Saccharicrinis aurantiacus]